MDAWGQRLNFLSQSIAEHFGVCLKTKKITKKNVIPAMSTYKLRDSEFYFNDVRIIPSYIMTGANILIEKSKFQMASEDIQTMMKIIY